MFRPSLCLLTACTLFTAVLKAQLVTFGGAGERKSSSVYYWDKGSNKFVGGYTFTYGSPVWKAEYDKMVAGKESGSMRLGKDDWAQLDSNVALTIGGTKIPAGQWYLGLRRDENKFFLMVMSAAVLREKKIPAWMTATIRATINAPLTYEKVDKAAKTLVISAVARKDDVAKAAFTLHWGNHRLTAPIVASFGPTAQDAAGRKAKAATKAGKKADK